MTTTVHDVLSVIIRDFPLMLNVSQAAKIIGTHPNTIHNWISANRCPFPTRKVGGLRRISAVDLAAYILRDSPLQKRGRPRKTIDT